MEILNLKVKKTTYLLLIFMSMSWSENIDLISTQQLVVTAC